MQSNQLCFTFDTLATSSAGPATITPALPPIARTMAWESPRERAERAIRSDDLSGLTDLEREWAYWSILYNDTRAMYALTVVLHTIRRAKRIRATPGHIAKACGLAPDRCKLAATRLEADGSIRRVTSRNVVYYEPVGDESTDWPPMPHELATPLTN